MIVTEGSTDVTAPFYFVDDVDGTKPGEPTTGLLFSDIETGGSASYQRQGAARVDFALITLGSASAAHDDGGFILIDDTEMPGTYRCDIPDAAVAAGVDFVIIYLRAASGNNTIARPLKIDLTSTVTGVSSRVFYLDSDASDDSGNGETWTAAKQTIAGIQALALVPGDTVVMRGLFREAATLSKDGLPALPITWQAATPLGATISGATVIVNGSFAAHEGGPAYKITMADPILVLEDDGSITGAAGRDNKVMLAEESSIANVIANAGRWFHDGTDLYVHATDSTDITANGYTYEGGSETDVVTVTGDDVVLHEIRVEGGTADGITAMGRGMIVSRCDVRFTEAIGISLDGGNECLIDDCHIHETQDADGYAVFVDGDESIGNVVRRCRIEQLRIPITGVSASGVRVRAGGSITVEDSYIHAVGSQCFLMANSAGEVVIRHCFINGANFRAVNFTSDAVGGAVYGNLFVTTETNQTMLRVGDLSGDLVVFNNTFYNATSDNVDILFDGTFGRCIVKDNIVMSSGRTLKITVEAASTATVEMDNNLYFSDTGYAFSWSGSVETSLGGHQTASGQEANSVTGDPLFVDADAGDFSLQDGSPAIGMGADLADILASLTLEQRYRQLIAPGSRWPMNVQRVNQGADGLGLTVGAFAPGGAVYWAELDVTIDTDGVQDEYTVVWHRGDATVTSGITSPTIQVAKRLDGADLVASTAMTQIGTSGKYKYDETTPANRLTLGEASLATVSATIGGSVRTQDFPVGRDDHR